MSKALAMVVAWVVSVGATAQVGAQGAPAAGAAPLAAPAPLATRILTSKDMLDIANAGRAKQPGEPMVSSNLFTQAPYRVNVEHRIAGSTPPSIHERNAEMFFVVDGEGVFITGGELVDPVRRNPTNMAGTAIRGGQTRAVAKGDVIIVPAGVPHMIADVRKTLTMVATHLPNVSQ